MFVKRMGLKKNIFLRTWFLLILLVVCITGAMVYFAMERNQRHQMAMAMQNAQLLASRCEKLVLWDDRVALKSLLSASVKETTGMTYGWLAQGGKLYVHTFPRGFLALRGHAGAPLRVQTVESHDGRKLVDIAVTVPKTGTVLHAGFSVAVMRGQVLGLIAPISIMAVLMLILGAWVAERIAAITSREVETVTTALAAARDKAEIATRSKSKFLAHLNNEVRTPLNTITGMTHLLLNDVGDAKHLRYVNTIFKSSQSILSIMNDLFDYSRLEAQVLDLEHYDFDLRHMVDDSVALLASRARQKGLSFEVQWGPNVPDRVKGDPGRVRRVLSNIIGNAIRYTEEGGMVLSVRLMDGTDAAATVQFEVSDSGCGMSGSRLAALRASMDRAGVLPSGKDPEIGLGLSIAQQLVALMGGTFSVDSELGVGSLFAFSVVFEKSQPAGETGFKMLQDMAGLRIMVVCDSKIARYVLREQLAVWDVCVEEAANGDEAVARLQAAFKAGSPFQMVFIEKEVQDGGEALGRRIRADGRFADVPLLMLAAMGERGDVARMQEAGFDAYLMRPVNRTVLFDVISAVLSRRTGGDGGDDEAGRDGASWPAGAPIITRHILAEVRSQRTRILLLEKTTRFHGSTRALFSKLGYFIEVAPSVRDGLEALKHHGYHMLVLDDAVPGLTEASWRSLTEQMADTGVPVVVLDSGIREDGVVPDWHGGDHARLKKPVALEALSEAIETRLPDAASLSGCR